MNRIRTQIYLGHREHAKAAINSNSFYFLQFPYSEIPNFFEGSIDMIRKAFVATFLVAISTSASAGYFGLTHFSRANCVNNESISWDNSRAQLMRVYSLHNFYIEERSNPGVKLVQSHRVYSKPYANFKLYPKGGWEFSGAKAIHYNEGNWTPPNSNNLRNWEWRVHGKHTYLPALAIRTGRVEVRTSTSRCDVVDGYAAND